MILRIGQLSRGKSKGFTFIEIVLVTIIILILVGFIPPLFRKSFSGIQLKETCQNLTQLMRYVQARAIAERKVCRINFDFEQGTFWATFQSEDSTKDFEGIKGRWGKTFNLPSGISIKARDEIAADEETSYIGFYPDGTSDKATIEIFDEKDETYAISAQRAIGYVKVEK